MEELLNEFRKNRQELDRLQDKLEESLILKKILTEKGIDFDAPLRLSFSGNAYNGFNVTFYKEGEPVAVADCSELPVRLWPEEMKKDIAEVAKLGNGTEATRRLYKMLKEAR